MNLSFSEIVTSFTVWEFLSQLAKPFNQMDIYRVGIIDARCKFLKEPKDYETVRERTAGSAFNRLVVIILPLLFIVWIKRWYEFVKKMT